MKTESFAILQVQMSKPIIPGFTGDLVTSSDNEYESLLHRWAKNSIRQAAVIACAKDEADVLLVLAYAKDNDMELVVKCEARIRLADARRRTQRSWRSFVHGHCA